MKNKKMQFSKAHVVFANILVTFAFTFSTIANFVLSIMDKMQIDFALAITVVGAYAGFATGGYFAQNTIRDTSLNKHGIHIDDGDKHYIEKTEDADNA